MEDIEHRISILLNLVERETAEHLLGEMPTEPARRIRQRLENYRSHPPADAQVDGVLMELERVMALADQAAASNASHHHRRGAAAYAAHRDSEEEPFEPSEDAVTDLLRLNSLRLVGALATETPRTVAVLLSAFPTEQAGAILQQLPAEMRTETLLKMQAGSQLPRPLIRKLAEALREKALAIDLEALQSAREDKDAKLAKLLRSLEREDRAKALEALDQQDQLAAARVRRLLYSLDDLLRMDDRSLQRVLVEIDMTSLAQALKNADPRISERILQNMSRRARETFAEESDLLTNLKSEERAAAEEQIIQILLQLDEKGDLIFIDQAQQESSTPAK